MVEAKQYPLTKPLLAYILPKFLGNSAAAHRKYSADKADRRMQLQTDRPDFMSYILKHNETEKGMSPAEIREGASVFILAGSETVSLLHTMDQGSLLMNIVFLDGFPAHRSHLSTTSKSTCTCQAFCRDSRYLQDSGRNDTSQVSRNGIPTRLFGRRLKNVSSGTGYVPCPIRNSLTCLALLPIFTFFLNVPCGARHLSLSFYLYSLSF